MIAPEPTLTAVDALGVVEQWLDDDEEMRIPGNEWGTRLYEALKDVVRSAREPGAEPALVAEVRRLRAKVAAVEAVERGLSEGWVMLATVSDRAEFVRTFRAALATTGEGQHVAREVFTAEGIPFVRCSCTNAKSPTSSRWLTEHVPNGGVAELQAVVKRQAEGEGMSAHWLIRYDPDDGEPYGEVCDCEIGDDHDATGEGE